MTSRQPPNATSTTSSPTSSGSPATAAIAEDLTGETFERALRLWHRYDPRRGSERTWLCQVARSVALDHFRSERRRRREELAAARIDMPSESDVDGLSPELETALRSLSAAEREMSRYA